MSADRKGGKRKFLMKIIISPAKKMKQDTDTILWKTMPYFLEKTEEILKWMQTLSYEERKKLWMCNDKIAELNDKRITEMELKKGLTPALLAYEGIQYQYMAPTVFETEQWDYIEEHLRILSGFYGILRPYDGVVPYRLEMRAKADINGTGNLYQFWGKQLYQFLEQENDFILNLASKEYAKCIEPYLSRKITYVTCIFGEKINGKIVQKGTIAKMARGEMVRFLAEQKAEKPEIIKQFNRLSYQFSKEDSSDNTLVFLHRIERG